MISAPFALPTTKPALKLPMPWWNVFHSPALWPTTKMLKSKWWEVRQKLRGHHATLIANQISNQHRKAKESATKTGSLTRKANGQNFRAQASPKVKATKAKSHLWAAANQNLKAPLNHEPKVTSPYSKKRKPPGKRRNGRDGLASDGLGQISLGRQYNLFLPFAR